MKEPVAGSSTEGSIHRLFQPTLGVSLCVRGVPPDVLESYADDRILDLEVVASQGVASAVTYKVRPSGGRVSCRPTIPTRPHDIRWRPHKGHGLISTPHGHVKIVDDEPRQIDGPDPSDPVWLPAVEDLLDVAFSAAAASQSVLILHTSAWRLAGRSVMAIGASRSGKTTLAVAAFSCGGSVLGDDAALLGFDRHHCLQLVSFRKDVILRRTSRRVMEPAARETLPMVSTLEASRWVIPRDRYRERFLDRLAPGLLLIASIDRRLRESRIVPLDQARALSALIMSSAPLYLSHHFPKARSRAFPVLVQLARTVPGYRVRLGRDLLDDPAGTMARLLGGGT